VIERFYEKVLIEQQLYSVLKNAMDEERNGESWYFGGVDVSGKLDEIDEILQLYEGREYRETPILNRIDEITDLLKHNYDDSRWKILLDLFYAVMIEKENDKKPAEFHSWSYRSGLETLNFFVDIINDYAGYTELYYDEMGISDDDWKEQMKPFRQNPDNPYIQNIYPHVLMIIDKPEFLLEISDQRGEDWIEAMIVRLVNSHRFRRHFPVIFETSKNKYFNFEIFNKLSMNPWEIPNIDFPGFEDKDQEVTLSKIYNLDQAIFLFYLFGKSVYHKHIFTEIAVRSKRPFIELYDRVVKDLPGFAPIKREFYRNLNKVYNHPLLGPELDSGEIDFLVASMLEIFLKSKSRAKITV
jgi:hypothetical protein